MTTINVLGPRNLRNDGLIDNLLDGACDEMIAAHGAALPEGVRDR